MRLIDADALKDSFCNHCNTPFLRDTSVADCRNYRCDTMDAVDDAPTIDAVPVVRCKDCRNGCRIDGHEDRVWCNHWDFDSDKNDFCSYGERKEETE